MAFIKHLGLLLRGFGAGALKLIKDDTATPSEQMLRTIGALAIVWYFASIICVGCEVITKDGKWAGTPIASSASSNVNTQARTAVGLYEFMKLSITSIGTTLATFVGMFLGLKQVADNRVGSGSSSIGVSRFQRAAAWAYVLSLILALLIWARRLDGLDPVVATLAASFLGLLGGALAVMLNTQPSGADVARVVENRVQARLADVHQSRAGG